MDENTTPTPAPAATATTTTPAPEPKPIWQSKTMWLSAITVIAPLIPGVGPAISAWIGVNPQLVTAGLGAVFGVMRYVSHGKVTIN